MATFKAIILKHQKKSDDTYNVKIRVTSNRKSAYISTNIYVNKKDITKSFKIKNQAVIEKTEEIIRGYRTKLLRISTISEGFSPHEIIEYISREEKFRLDFISYSKERIKSMSAGTGKGYLVAINSFTKFLGKECLQIEDLTSSLLRSYKEYLEDSGLKRAVSSYPGYLRALFNMACDDYNGEHIDNWNIKHNPFSKFKVPKTNVAEKRALSVEQIRAIINLPYRESWGLKAGQFNTYNMAKDCFVLSLCLLGINSADMYGAENNYKDGVFSYKRQKTRTRRDDEALMCVKVDDRIRKLFDKYAGDERLFIFHKKYSSSDNFNAYINRALKEIEADANKMLSDKINDLEFYAARHSMATIAQNKAGIDKYTVHEMLNHAYEGDMKVTDRYTEKDWNRLWDANKKVLDIILEKEYDCDESKCVSVERISRSGVVKSPEKGIYPKGNVFRTFAKVGPEYKYIGTFPTLEEAIKKRDEYLSLNS